MKSNSTFSKSLAAAALAGIISGAAGLAVAGSDNGCKGSSCAQSIAGKPADSPMDNHGKDGCKSKDGCKGKDGCNTTKTVTLK